MKIGDKVRIKSNAKIPFFNKEMIDCKGKVLTVEKVTSAFETDDEIKVKECKWLFWTKELEMVSQIERKPWLDSQRRLK